MIAARARPWTGRSRVGRSTALAALSLASGPAGRRITTRMLEGSGMALLGDAGGEVLTSRLRRTETEAAGGTP